MNDLRGLQKTSRDFFFFFVIFFVVFFFFSFSFFFLSQHQIITDF